MDLDLFSSRFSDYGPNTDPDAKYRGRYEENWRQENFVHHVVGTKYKILMAYLRCGDGVLVI